MSAYKRVALWDVAPAESARVGRPKVGPVWSLGLEHIESGTGTILTRNVVEPDELGSSTHAFTDEHVLYSKLRPNLNKVALPDTGGWCTTELLPLRPDPARLDRRYLAHYLKSFEFVSWATSRTDGAKMPRVKMDELRSHLIPLPSLPEQKQIATLLGKADSIRRKRSDALILADEFLSSVFLDRFGDPVANPNGWPKITLGNLGTLDRGKSRHRPRDEPSLYGGSHPFIQTGDVANCDGIVRDYTQTYSDLGLSQSRKWPAGTLAITIAANIGKTGILGFDACFPDSVVGFTAKPPISVEFIQFWLAQIQNRLEETAPQSAQKNINLEILRDLPVPIPTHDLMKQFTSLVRRTREAKLRQQHLLAESELLFGSIQQRAFNGHTSPS